LYVIDRFGNRELLYLDPEIASMCPSPLRARQRPPGVAAHRDPDLAAAGLGQLTLMDVYQGLEPDVERGRVKYLRVCAEVRADLQELPDGQCQADHEPFQDWYATPIHKVSGPHGWPSYVAKASLGLVEIDATGAATFTVPANRVLYFEVLDEQYNELQRMRSVVQLQAGEQRSCLGCHEPRQTAPAVQQPQQRLAGPVPLQAPPWGAGPFGYERIVQPVWDAHCVACHDAQGEHGLDLSGHLDQERVPASYRTLIEGGWVHYFDFTYKLRHHKAQPGTFGTLQSKLWEVLDAGHYDVQLNDSELRAVKCWIDLNCPLWPDYQFRPDRGSSEMATSK
jgi:cytochrome c553